jgi:uroporphyrinogen-III synthase
MQTAVLTRPLGSNDALAARLRGVGWQVYEWPGLQIERLPDHGGPIPMPEDFDLAVFVSGHAARLYLQQLRVRGLLRWPSCCVAATVGPGTATVLRASGWFSADVPIVYPGLEASSHDAQGLWQCLRAGASPLPQRVLMVRATEGDNGLVAQLRQQGIKVCLHAVYRRLPVVWHAEVETPMLAWAEAGCCPVWLLTSGASIAAIKRNIAKIGLIGWWQRCRFVLIHPRLVSHLDLSGTSTADISVCVPAEDAIFKAVVSRQSSFASVAHTIAS